MPWGAAIGAVGAIGGGLIGSDSSRKAANVQADAAKRADETQQREYNQTRQDNMPWMQRGNAAGDRLSYLSGLSSGPGGSSLAGARLVDTSSGVPQPNLALYTSNPAYRDAWDAELQRHINNYGIPYNEHASAAEIEKDVSRRLSTQINASNSTAQQDPLYGSLLRNFTQDDLNNDVVYKTGLQFGLDEGTKGVNRLAAASGNMLSGATLKALTRYGNDIASTKAGDAYNRFNTNKLNTFNMLSGIAGTGQVAGQQVTSAGQNMANNISQNQIGVGNARGASAIAQGNALTGAIGQGVNWYQQNQLMRQQQPSYLTNYTPQYAGVGDQGWTSQG